MPGDYFVPTRLPGTQITELIYNSDHQNHVDGRDAEFTGAYGISASQYQLTEDPYPGSVENLPPSLAGELTRLRFVIAQIIGELSGGAAVNWYDPINNPGFPFLGARIGATVMSVPNNLVVPVSFSGGTEDFNTGVFDAMTQPTRFTAPFAGKYLAFCWFTWPANTTGRRQTNVGMNAFTTPGVSITNLASINDQQQSLTSLFDMAANDYVQFSVFQNSGSSLNLTINGGGLVFLGS